jgi:hypothetical protein
MFKRLTEDVQLKFKDIQKMLKRNFKNVDLNLGFAVKILSLHRQRSSIVGKMSTSYIHSNIANRFCRNVLFYFARAFVF